MTKILLVPISLVLIVTLTIAQNQKQKSEKLTIEHIHYRQAVWDSIQIKEHPYAVNNRGGYLFIYFRNTSSVGASPISA